MLLSCASSHIKQLSPELTSGRSVSMSAFSATATTTMSSAVPYDSKLWIDKHIGSHRALSELSVYAPLNFALPSPRRHSRACSTLCPRR